MIVEFLGMPGSGKTTLARTLLAELERFGKAPMTFETACRKLFYQRLPRPLAKILPFTIFHLGLSRIIFRIWHERRLQQEFITLYPQSWRAVQQFLPQVKKSCPQEFSKRKRWLEFKLQRFMLFKLTVDQEKILLCDEGVSSSPGCLFVNSSSPPAPDEVKKFLKNSGFTIQPVFRKTTRHYQQRYSPRMNMLNRPI